MAPTAVSPTGKRKSTDPQENQLDKIEQTLRRLEKNTLQIKRRNEKTINSFDRKSQSSPNGSWAQYSRPDKSLCQDSSYSYSGAPDAPGGQNVPSVSEAPPKPPRAAAPQPKPRGVMRPEVSQALMESADVRQKMYDTLKACAADREKHRQFMEQMKLESQQLVPVPSVGINATTTAPGSSVLSKTKNAFRGLISKLSYSDKFKIPQTNSSKIQQLNELPTNINSIPLETTLQNEIPADPVLQTGPKEHTQGPIVTNSTGPPPVPKPRSSKPRTSTTIEKSPEISKPPVQPINPTLDDLKKFCQLGTDDESTLPHPLNRTPSAESDKASTEGDFESDERSSSSSSSEEDFGEYIPGPVVYKTCSVSTDSEADSKMSTRYDFSKNRKTAPTPKLYRYNAPKTKDLREVPLSSRQKLSDLRRQLSRPPSPPPRKLVRSPAFPFRLPQFVEELSSSSDESSTSPTFMDSLLVPTPQRLESPPPSPISRDYDDLPVFTDDHTWSLTPPPPPSQHQTSALCSGIQISPIAISVVPWECTGDQEQRIYWTQPRSPESEDSCWDTFPRTEKESDDVTIQRTIDEDFGFLSEIEDFSPEADGKSEVLKSDDPKAVVPAPRIDVQRIGGLARSLVEIGSSKPIENEDVILNVAEGSTEYGQSTNEMTTFEEVIPSADLKMTNIDVNNIKILAYPPEIWNVLQDSFEESCQEMSKSSDFHAEFTVESETEFMVEDYPVQFRVLTSLESVEVLESEILEPAVVEPTVAKPTVLVPEDPKPIISEPTVLEQTISETTDLVPEVSKPVILKASNDTEIENKMSSEDLPQLDEMPPKLPSNPPPPPSTNILESFPIFPEPGPPISSANASGGLPPPPPAMPLNPIFLESPCPQNKSWVNLPVVPLNNMSKQETIFDKFPSIDAQQLTFDMTFIQDNFISTTSGSLPKSPKAKMSEVIPSESSILSQNRVMVIKIGTKKLSQSTEIILTSLKTLNVEFLSVDDIQILLQILPKENETTLYKDTSSETLSKEERLMKSLSEIPRVTKKLNAMNFMLNFEEHFKSLESAINLLQVAAQSVKNSENFPKIIQVVLVVINTAFVKNAEPMRGFEINSLQRLLSKKSSDGKFSLLNCITKCLETNCPDALHFYNDFSGIEGASKITKSEVSTLVAELEKDCDDLKNEISEIICEKGSETGNDLKKASDFLEKSFEQIAIIRTRWDETLKEIEGVAGYFGMSPTPLADIKDFFLIILNFVNDYKKTLAQNNRLFTTNSPKSPDDLKMESLTNGQNSEVKMRIKPKLEGYDTSVSVDPHRRRSLSQILLTRKLEEESGQSREFVDTVAYFGQPQFDAARKRHRGPRCESKPIRKTYGSKHDGDRERTLN